LGSNPGELVDLMAFSYDLLEIYPTFKKGEMNISNGELFRKFHTLKARYGQFGAKDLTYYINEVETSISNGEFDKLESNVDKFNSNLQEFVKKNRLIIEAANKFMIDQGNAVQVSDILYNKDKFSDLENLFSHLRENYLLSDIKEKFKRYNSLIDELADKQSKVIDSEFTGDKIKVDTNKYSNFINTSIHLFRNMVDHGIENEDERIEKAKPQRGQIKVDFKNNGDTFIIQMADDGGGIDPERITEKVLEKRLKSEKDLKSLKDSDLVDMIFLPGFFTKEEVTDVSGRGVGMDAV
jgi:Chemotaxis protein histidine kinase and related kinases